MKHHSSLTIKPLSPSKQWHKKLLHRIKSTSPNPLTFTSPHFTPALSRASKATKLPAAARNTQLPPPDNHLSRTKALKPKFPRAAAGPRNNPVICIAAASRSSLESRARRRSFSESRADSRIRDDCASPREKVARKGEKKKGGRRRPPRAVRAS